MSDEKKDIFKQAAEQHISIEVSKKDEDVELVETEEIVEDLSMIDKAISVTKELEWNTLKHNLQTKHAAKFDRILSTLPDRDFIRVYLKALEFVKPKITRVENDGPKEEEKSMNILIVKSGNDDKQTIDITDYGKE